MQAPPPATPRLTTQITSPPTSPLTPAPRDTPTVLYEAEDNFIGAFVSPYKRSRTPTSEKLAKKMDAIETLQTNRAKVSALHSILKSLQFGPADHRLSWLSGIRKPLPHPLLDTNANDLILARLYEEEIQRVFNLKREKEKQFGGDWTYDFYGETVEVVIGGAGSGIAPVFSRGLWTQVKNGELRTFEDEWPVDVWGERVGWGIVPKAKGRGGRKKKVARADEGGGEGKETIEALATVHEVGSGPKKQKEFENHDLEANDENEEQ